MKSLKNLQSSSFLSSYMGKICIALYFSKFDAWSLKWPIMGASTLLHKSLTNDIIIMLHDLLSYLLSMTRQFICNFLLSSKY